MAVSQPYVVQGQNREPNPIDYLTMGAQFGQQMQSLTQHIENQRMNDVRSMEEVIKEWQSSGMFHQRIKEQPGFFKNYLSKVTRVQDPGQLDLMYDQYATGLRNWQEQQTTTQAMVGELGVRGQKPPEPAPVPTPTPTPTPNPPAEAPVNASLKGDVTQTVKTTTGPMDYQTFLDESTKAFTSLGIQLDPTTARGFFVPDPNKKQGGVSYEVTLGDLYNKAKKFGKDPAEVIKWVFQDANWQRRAQAIGDMEMSRVASNESKYKDYENPSLAPTYTYDQGQKAANQAFHALPPAPGPRSEVKPILFKDRPLGEVANGVFKPTANVAKVDRQVVLKQLAAATGWSGEGKGAYKEAVELSEFANIMWARNDAKYMQKHPEFKTNEEAKRAFLGQGGHTPAWKEVGLDLEIATPVDLSLTEVVTANPSIPKSVNAQVKNTEPLVLRDVEKLEQLPAEDLGNALMAMQQQRAQGEIRIMDYEEAQGDIERLDRDASYLAAFVRNGPTAYAALKKNIERVTALSGGAEVLLGNSGLGNSAKDMMGMAAYLNAQANWAEASAKLDPDSAENKLTGKKLQLDTLKVEKELRDLAGGTAASDAISKEQTLFLKGFNDVSAKVAIEHPEWRIGDIIKNNGAAQALFRQYMFATYKTRPENRGKSQEQLAASFEKALVKIQTDKNWDNYEMFVLPEVAHLVRRPGTEGGGAAEPAPSTAPQKKKMDPAQRERINQARVMSGLPPVNEYGE